MPRLTTTVTVTHALPGVFYKAALVTPATCCEAVNVPDATLEVDV